jgi:tRNA-5-methyluridine54 2-sulfurtransferase
MKCQKCAQTAAINLRQHHLPLCKDHFLEWVLHYTQVSIEKYHMFSQQEKVLVAVSGGKDSLGLWDILWKLGYQADGIYINLGIESDVHYSAESGRFAKEFAESRNLKLYEVDLKKEYGETIAETAKRSRKGRMRPCSVCGLVKRYIMNKTATDFGYEVLVTGHNLDDEAGVLMGNTLNWSVDMLVRQSPVLPSAPGFTRKAKPLCRFYERETAAYSILQGINYIYDECPYSTDSKLLYYKDILNRMEGEIPGLKMRFYTGFLQSRKEGLLAIDQLSKDGYLLRCPNCGQPTSTPGPCSFCRMMYHLT